MTHYKLALLGFGNVGRALANLLQNKRRELQDIYQITFSVTGFATGSPGMAINPDGIDIDAALGADDLSKLSRLPAPSSASEFIRMCEADVLFENTPVDYGSGEPAISHLRLALEQGMHVVTANKGPVVHAFSELSNLAEVQGRKFYFESTVMDGAPIFSLFRGAIPAAQLKAFSGVLNSTTNMILTRIEQGDSFEQAVIYCQEIGIAETDPSGDIDGWDAAIKVAALATVLMGIPFLPEDVDRQGIGGITLDKIQKAKQDGKRWKLVCRAEKKDGGVIASVQPELVGPNSPMYAVSGTTSVVVFETDVLGDLSIIEQDPGPHTTAYGLLADFINAVRS